MIEIKKQPGQRLLELGGGANPVVHPCCLGGDDLNVDVRMCYAADGRQSVDFAVDLESFPWPLKDAEWDGVVCVFTLEHINFNKVPDFLKEVNRVSKPGARIIFALPNTQEQFRWIDSHKDGWDGKGGFKAASEVLFGSLDYEANSHRAYFSPAIAAQLFQEAGFENVLTQPYGERNTDLVVQATKPLQPMQITQTDIIEKPSTIVPIASEAGGSTIALPGPSEAAKSAPALQNGGGSADRALLFDKVYFNGGGKVGGYAAGPGGAYQDFPCHNVTFQHVMARKPESVLEIGASRGYILKRLEDAGIRSAGLEISRHCWMTRVANCVKLHDICTTPWPVETGAIDLLYSVATLEHIPEQFIPAVIKEMNRVSKRGLHGIDFGGRDDGFDKTHCSLHEKSWWERMFSLHAPGWPVEILDKEELERGNIAPEVHAGDGHLKVQAGSFTTMFHYGWQNIDVHDLAGFAAAHRYNYTRHDVRVGLPYGTGVVDRIFAHHFLEHLTYPEGVTFLRECRRVIRPDGAMRLVMPDAETLIKEYHLAKLTNPEGPVLNMFDEINDGCAAASTQAEKLHALLLAGHASVYDMATICHALTEAGWDPYPASFRSTSVPAVIQILKETTEMTFGGLSLFVDAVPKVNCLLERI